MVLTLKVKKYNITFPTDTSISVTEVADYTYTDNTNILSDNVGITDGTDLYLYRVNSSNQVHLIKIDITQTNNFLQIPSVPTDGILTLTLSESPKLLLEYQNSKLFLTVKVGTTYSIYDYPISGISDIKLFHTPSYTAQSVMITTYGDALPFNNSSVGTSYQTSGLHLHDVDRIFNTPHNFASINSLNYKVDFWGDSNFSTSDPSSEIITFNSIKSDLNTFHTDGTYVLDIIPSKGNYGAYAALKSDGSVVTWGYKTGGGDKTVGVVNGSVSNIDTSLTNPIVASIRNYAAIKTDGSVVMWGSNNEFDMYFSMPEEIKSSGANVVKLFASQNAFAALTGSGNLYCWGEEQEANPFNSVMTSVFPDSDDIDFSSASQNYFLKNVVDVKTSINLFAVLISGGGFGEGGRNLYKIYSWGGNYGNFTTADDRLYSTGRVVSIVSNSNAFTAILDSKQIYSWGYNNMGGDLKVKPRSGITVSLNTSGAPLEYSSYDSGGTQIEEVKANPNSFIAITSSSPQSIFVWGNGNYGGAPCVYTESGDSKSALASNANVTFGSAGGESEVYFTNVGFTNLDNLSIGMGSYTLLNYQQSGKILSWGNVNSGGDSTNPGGYGGDGSFTSYQKIYSSWDSTNMFFTAAYYTFMVGLKTDGTYQGWGQTQSITNFNADILPNINRRQFSKTILNQGIISDQQDDLSIQMWWGRKNNS